jgi:hypothetical protein
LGCLYITAIFEFVRLYKVEHLQQNMQILKNILLHFQQYAIDTFLLEISISLMPYNNYNVNTGFQI